MTQKNEITTQMSAKQKKNADANEINAKNYQRKQIYGNTRQTSINKVSRQQSTGGAERDSMNNYSEGVSDGTKLQKRALGDASHMEAGSLKDDVQRSKHSVLRSHLSDPHSSASSQSESEIEDDVEVFIPEGGQSQNNIDAKKSMGSLQSRHNNAPAGFNESGGAGI